MLSAISVSSRYSQEGAVMCARVCVCVHACLCVCVCVLTAQAESVLKSGGSELSGLTDSLAAPLSMGLLRIEWW